MARYLKSNTGPLFGLCLDDSHNLPQYFVVWIGGFEFGLLLIELQKDLNTQRVISNMA